MGAKIDPTRDKMEVGEVQYRSSGPAVTSDPRMGESDNDSSPRATSNEVSDADERETPNRIEYFSNLNNP